MDHAHDRGPMRATTGAAEMAMAEMKGPQYDAGKTMTHTAMLDAADEARTHPYFRGPASVSPPASDWPGTGTVNAGGVLRNARGPRIIGANT